MTTYRAFQNSDRDGAMLLLAVAGVFAVVLGGCWIIGFLFGGGM